MSIGTIDQAVEALRAGKPVLVVDDEARENEGDAIISASLATQEWMAWIVRNSSGYICAPMPAELADRLELPIMVAEAQDPRHTAYTVSVDAADGVTTGISASDRAHTLRVLADPASTPASLIRPGHILPLRAVPGGVRERAGHTEAGVDLMRLAGLPPVAAIAELVADDGEMLRLPGVIALGDRADLPVVTIAQIVERLEGVPCDVAAIEAAGYAAEAALAEEGVVRFEVETNIPTTHGTFRTRAYRDLRTGADHVALIADGPQGPGAEGATLIRVHSECLTGEVFGSMKCECGPQLDAALDQIAHTGGVVIYMRGHEGRGIGLINKLKAYALQEKGLDTLEANLALGFPPDGRDYRAASAILTDLGVSEVTVITNNPDKIAQLEANGVPVVGRVPLVVGVGEFNEAYLETKRDRMGHRLPEGLDAFLEHDHAHEGAHDTKETTR